MRGPLMMMRGKPAAGGGSGYLDVAAGLGALTVQDGLDDAMTASAYAVTGTVTEPGTDPYGHTTALAQSVSSLNGTLSLSSPGSYTLVGATSLASGGTSDFSRLGVFGAGFISRAAARTSPSKTRHTFAPDPGTWHWFAFTVDHSSAIETSIVYRDASVYSPEIIADDAVPDTGSLAFEFGGAAAQSARNIGHFSACAIFPSALTATQVADLYAAYQNGL